MSKSSITIVNEKGLALDKNGQSTAPKKPEDESIEGDPKPTITDIDKIADPKSEADKTFEDGENEETRKREKLKSQENQTRYRAVQTLANPSCCDCSMQDSIRWTAVIELVMMFNIQPILIKLNMHIDRKNLLNLKVTILPQIWNISFFIYMLVHFLNAYEEALEIRKKEKRQKSPKENLYEDTC